MGNTIVSQSPRSTKERLVDAMIRVIGTGGPHAASVRAIAREADCNEAVLYQHFPNKAAMQEAIWLEIASDMAKATEPIASSVDTVEAFIEAWTETILGYYDAHPNAFAFAVFTFPPIAPDSTVPFAEFDTAFIEGVSSFAPSLRTDGPTKALVRSLFFGVPREIHLGMLDGPAVSHAERVQELILAAVKA